MPSLDRKELPGQLALWDPLDQPEAEYQAFRRRWTASPGQTTSDSPRSSQPSTLLRAELSLS